MNFIDSLNRNFGDSLGRPDGNSPRFAWLLSSEIATGFGRRLADQIGKRWLICQWMPNQFTRTEWDAIHQGAKPYPGVGGYVPHAETALPFGMMPTTEATAFYIGTLRQQMEAAEEAQKANAAGRIDDISIASQAEAQAYRDEADANFYEQVADWEPLGWKLGEPHEPGDQDGPVAFQVGGSRDEIAAPTAP